jgi:ABC-2 type transport system ATP-binding protein/lipopolysaccharide transport system ATP-binding protein
LRKADELRNQGVTILFVSHDMDAIRELCDRAIWLDGGGVQAEGEPEAVVSQYLRGFAEGDLAEIERGRKLARGQRWGSGEIEITDVRFLDEEGREQACFVTGEPLQVEMRYVAHKRVENPVFGMAFHSAEGAWINGSNTSTSGFPVGWVEGAGVVRYRLEELSLLEGSYLFTATAYDFSGEIPVAYDHLDKSFIVQLRSDREVRETLGMVYMPCCWEHRRTA